MKILVLNPPSRIIKNVVRDLLYGCWCRGKRIGGTTFPPLNLLYVATVLRETGHTVDLVDACGEQKTIAEISKNIKEYDVVVISTSTMSFNEDASVLLELKKHNTKLISIVFGSHPSFSPAYSLAKDGVDIVVIKEPEFIIRDVICNLEKKDNSWKEVKGIGYKGNGRIVIKEDYPFIENLDELPFPDRRMLPRKVDYFNPLVKKMPYTTMLTSRGCPGRCSFCTVPSFYGGKIRSRSLDNILNELQIVQNLGYKEVFFRDETFTFYKQRNVKLCQEIIKKNMDLTWICNARIGTIDKEIMRLMKKAGCHLIKIGVESGVQQILDNLQKGIKLEMTRKTFTWAHEVGMDIHAHVMLCSPGETMETINQTINFVKKIKPTAVTFGICTPYPGTMLFSEVSQKHPEIKDGSVCSLDKIHTKAFFNEDFTSLTKQELEKSVKRAYRSFYLRPVYFLKWLKIIKNWKQLWRVILAGEKIIDFSIRGD